jgi:hypothetical protein
MFSLFFFRVLYWIGIVLTSLGILTLIGLFVIDAGRKKLW